MDVGRLIAKRLREARKLLGWTQTEAARRLGISREYLSLFETGKRPVPLRLLSRLADLYARPVSWFYGISEPTGTFQLLLREAERRELSPEDRHALVRFCHLAEEVARLRQLLGRPETALPYYPTPRAEAVEEQARQAASAERARLGLNSDPLPNLIETLEAAGIVIIRLPLKEGESAGGMAYDADKGGFLLVNAVAAQPHQNWMAAHLYAHLLKDRDRCFLLHERGPQKLDAKGARDLTEQFANRFAAHFLMPEETVRRLMNRLWPQWLGAALMPLRRTFGVSFSALLTRLRELNYLTSDSVLLPSGYVIELRGLSSMTDEEVARWEAPLWRLEQSLTGSLPSSKPREPSGTLWELALAAASRGEITIGYCADLLNISVMEAQDILTELEEAANGVPAE